MKINRTILIVEDELPIAELEKDYLELSDFEVTIETDGIEGEAKAMSGEYDLLILDVMLPGQDGFEICRKYREKYLAPVIVVSAKKEDIDKIHGLGLGADDYITKPFNILEVKARIKAILRRSGKKAEPVKPVNILEINGMKVELDSRRVFVHGKELNLTAKEFDLLELLMAHPNKVYSRNELLDTIWGSTYPGDARTVDVHVRRLREKIEENPGEPVYIHTKWGVGYYFKG